MPNQQKYQLLAYLMTALQANGFRVGTGQQLRLQQLMENLPDDIPLDKLKTRLAPIFVKSSEEQQLFYELFEEAKQHLEVKESPSAAPITKPKNLYKKWIWIAAAMVAIAVVISLWFRLNPPEVSYEYLEKSLPIISQTILKNDTATIPLADAFRANELLQLSNYQGFIAYALCDGLSEHTDLSVGFSSIDSLGNLTYIAQDTGEVRSCVTMAFELQNDAITIVDTVLVEINVEARIITKNDEPIANTGPPVENILPLRPYPVKRNIDELTAPQPEGWAKAYLTFENKWSVWTETISAFVGIFYFLVVGWLVWIYFRKDKKLINFKNAILRIPYKVNLPFYKRKFNTRIDKETEAVYNELLNALNSDSEIHEELIRLTMEFPSQERRRAKTKGGYEEPQQSYSQTNQTSEQAYTIFDDPFAETPNIFEDINTKKTIAELLESTKAADFKKEVLTATFTMNFNKILNIVLPVLGIALAVFVFLELLVQFHIKFIFSLLIGGLLWAIARFRADDRKIVAELDTAQKAPFVWNIQIPDNHKIIYDQNFYSALNQLRQRTEDQFYKLNVPETVKATIQSGGQIDFQYTQQTKPPEYLMLIDRRSAANHRAALFNMLFESFKANDVIVERFYFDGDIRLVFNESHLNGIRLKDLKYQFQSARLLILSDGYSLLNAQTGKLSKWTDVLLAWKDKAIMTPNPPNNWGRRERQLAENFVILPSSVQGFQSVIEEFEATEPADFSKWQQIQAKSLEKIEFKGDLIETLKHYYAKGDDVRLIKWVAACAIYPTIHWDLTLSYGKLLADQTNDLSFMSLDNLLEINRLPWFVEGKIPQQVREELLLFLEKNDAAFLQVARQHLHELMQNNPPPKDSAAFEDYQMNVVINEMMMDNDGKRQKELEEQFRKMVEAGVEPDFTVLKYLDRPQSPLDFYVPDAWKTHVFNDGKPFFGRKNWTWAIPLWVILSVFIMAYYPSLPYCSGQSAEYDNRKLCLDDFADEMLLREFITLDFIQNENIIGADSMISLVKEIYKKEVFQPNVIDENGNLFFVNNKGKMISGNLSYFQNVSTAYYNKGVPFYNLAKANKYAWAEDSPDKNTACSFFKTAYDLDSTIQIYQDLNKECNGAVFNGYILPVLRGKVFDKNTKKPIADVQVILENRVVYQTKNQTGEYIVKLGKNPIFSLSIRFEKKQYLPQTVHFELKEGLEILDTVYLELDEKSLNIPSLPHPENERPPTQTSENPPSTNGGSQEQVPNQTNEIPNQTPQQNTSNYPLKPTIHIPTTVKVKGGTFYMGSGKDKDNERHTVSLSSYQIGKYEVTNKDFLDFIQDNSVSKVENWIDIGKRGSTKMYVQNGRFYIAKGFENHPIVGITWDGATEYCQWLSEKTGKKYRLPTEAEWEYAAKGGLNSKFQYSGSDNLNAVGWYNGNAKGTYAVGTRQANSLGVYDMSGNVWEWCSDWYEGNYLLNSPRPQKGQIAQRINPIGPLEVKIKLKVRRGGAFDMDADKSTVDFRAYAPQLRKSDSYGFRVVLEE
jgi:formylglycine-generating enzyme required for sulfatase activity